MIILSFNDIDRLSQWKEIFPVLEAGLISLEKGHSIQPVRQGLDIGEHGMFLSMPAVLDSEFAIVKSLATSERYTPSIQGTCILYDLSTGAPVALLDAQSITLWRTAAVSAIATNFLARKDAHRLGIVGTGNQAIPHIAAISQVRPLSCVSVWGRDSVKLQKICSEIEKQFDVGVIACKTPNDVAASSDIISTLTPGIEPLLLREAVKAGTHINAVGAHAVNRSEIDVELVAIARCYIDFKDAATTEAGEYVMAQQTGLIQPDHVIGSLAEILQQQVEGRKTDDDITLFKSLGGAIEDVSMASYLYKKALELKVGKVTDL